MNVNRHNFGRAVLAARAILGLNRLDLSSSARVGQETLARVERGDNNVTLNTLSAIQRALEEAGIEFPDGTNSIAIRHRGFDGLTGRGVVADPSMPSGVRFQ